MKIAIVYSSSHGHVRAIAERLAELAALRHVECTVTDVRSAATALDDADGALIAGSVHFGRHSRALRRFVTRKQFWLANHPCAFLSVSGSAAFLEGADEALRYLHDFLRVTVWTPDLTLSAAGAVLFTKYGPITRLMMKFASRTSGRKVDPTRDVVYTNWVAVDEFLHQFIDCMERHFHAVDERKVASLHG